MANVFKVQIPQHIVRNSNISDRAFVLLAKLIQAYYQQPGDNKQLTFTINHKLIMEYTNLPNRKKFVDCLKELHKQGYITNEIGNLPKKKGLEITLSKNVIAEFNKGQYFVQLEHYAIHKIVIEAIGHTGVKILYYIMSYINLRNPKKDKCFASVETIISDLGISNKTLKRYIDKMEKIKFIKVTRHKAETGYTLDKNGNENLLFYDRRPNEYRIRRDKFKPYIDKQLKLIYQEEQ